MKGLLSKALVTLALLACLGLIIPNVQLLTAASLVTVSGTIRHEGQPVSGVRVLVLWSGGGQDVTTGSDGRYRVSGVPTGGELMIFVRPPISMRLAFRNWGIDPLTADVVKDFDLERGYRLQGEFHQPDGQLYRETFWLGAEPLDFSPPEGEWFGDTVVDGRFDLVLPPSFYLLSAEPEPAPYYMPDIKVDLRSADVTDLIITLLEEQEEPTPRPPGELQVPPTPPIAELITVGPPDEASNSVITGAPGAVVPNSYVYLAVLDTGKMTATTAADDGSFQAELLAPPGTSIQIKHGYDPHFPVLTIPEEPVAWLNGLPGTIVRAPLTHQGRGGAVPFAVAGNIGLLEEGSGDWMVQGLMGPLRRGAGGYLLPISGTLRVTTPALEPGLNLSEVEVFAPVSLHRFFDREGRRVPAGGPFVSTFLTPTGLPISREPMDISPIRGELAVGRWRWTRSQMIEAEISGTLSIPSSVQPGYYRPQIELWFRGVPLGPVPLYPRGSGGNSAYLPMIRLGDPQPPHLIWTLLTNTLSNATRGTVAREDRPYFGLSPHIITQAEKFIVPRVDPRTGEPIAYRLEPFLPLIALADRGVPNPPLIPFKFPSGSLKVTVERPDGTVDTLGPAPFRQSTSRSPTNEDGKVLDDGGGRMDDVYQLTTLSKEFLYTFQQYGHHVITMTGTIEDIWGNVYQGGGTYDVYVARPLRIESGQLPTTPYEVGDVFSPGLHIYPPVPAEVEIRFELLINSDPADAVERVVAGRASRFGYFHPGPEFEPIVLSGPGEFRVDITARYEAPDGTLWMGSATWGNVVERPNTPLIAHGRRGLDLVGEIGPAWFFHRQLGFEGIAHTMYPYFSGDIFWGSQADNGVGGDSIIPMVTIQDTVGIIYSIIRERWEREHSRLFEGVGFEERMAADEAPLFSTTSDGQDLFWSPDKIDQYGYAYRSSERPGVRVHETISEDSLSIGYWRFNAEFGGQAGVEGDLPNDLKWEFGGAVFRLPNWEINEYAIYGSLWVLLPDDDPIGARVTPPFRGSGGPNGGPIMTLKGKEIDLFFMPKGVQPGDVLEVGDTFSFSGHVGPPLPSKVTVQVTSPSGAVRTISGRANKIGWFYDPTTDFIVDEPGVWTVEVRVEHDRPVSTGLAPTAYNTGGVLGSADGRYRFYVVPEGSTSLPIVSPEPGFLSWPEEEVTAVPITVSLPSGLADDAVVSYTIRMPGFILEEGVITPAGDTVTITYDPVALHEDFPNLDLKAKLADRPGLTDPVLITFLLAGRHSDGSVQRAGVVFLEGEEVFIGGGP